MALFLVLVGAVIVAMLLGFILQTGKRDSDSVRDRNERQSIDLLNQKLKNIFDAVDLCTCNLRGFVRPVSGDIVIGNPPLPNRGEFGYYKLSTDRSSPATLCPSPLDPKDVVLHTVGSYESFGSVKADQIVLSQFRLKEANVNGSDRYEAKFTFVTSQSLQRSRSNQSNPAELDIYIEIVGNTIKQCYRPGIVSSPAPSSPPSSPPSSLNSCMPCKINYGLPGCEGPQVIPFPGTMCGVANCCEWGAGENGKCQCVAVNRNCSNGSLIACTKLWDPM